MKGFLFLLLIPGLLSCNHNAEMTKVLQDRIDSLENKIADAYKPGFGEIMSSVQAHHAKLWFAGKNQNWKLADFEVHEIIEAMEDIRNYQTERKESLLIAMINPALDSMKSAIGQKNPGVFNDSFTLLTNACNQCHREVNFEFNVVKIPEVQTFSNQEFKTP